jgi:hypothetical protein
MIQSAKSAMTTHHAHANLRESEQNPRQNLAGKTPRSKIWGAWLAAMQRVTDFYHQAHGEQS